MNPSIIAFLVGFALGILATSFVVLWALTQDTID